MESGKFKGFTLIELLIVIAILGVLSVIVFIAIDPGERQAQARDTGRISSVTLLGHTVDAFYASRGGSFPTEGNWAQEIIDSGEVASFQSGITYTAYSVSNCTMFVQPAGDPTYCYDLDTVGPNGAIVFARAESNSHNDKCSSPEVDYFVFSTVDGRGGTICNNGDATAWAVGTMTYVD